MKKTLATLFLITAVAGQQAVADETKAKKHDPKPLILSATPLAAAQFEAATPDADGPSARAEEWAMQVEDHAWAMADRADWRRQQLRGQVVYHVEADREAFVQASRKKSRRHFHGHVSLHTGYPYYR